MLRIDKIQTIEGITVFGDDRRLERFFVIPDTPRIRLDPTSGTPMFQFFKYRFPIGHPDGRKGGGFCVFDIEFVVPAEKLQKIKETLQEQVNRILSNAGRPPRDVQIANIVFTKGTAGLNLENTTTGFVERVFNPGAPTLHGNLTTPFTVELSPEGATFFWEAMQGAGGTVQVSYDMHWMASLPEVIMRARFRAEKFYSFFQEIDVDWHLWGEDSMTETIRESLIDSESMSLFIDPGSGLTDAKVIQSLRDWGQRTLEDAVERKMLDTIEPVSAEDRKKPENIENVKRTITNQKVASFTLNYREKQAIEWNDRFQGTVPNITQMKKADGSAVRWEDHAREIDLDDEFFKTLLVKMRVNADFGNLPIHSVEIKLDYADDTKEFGFRSADDLEQYQAFLVNNSRAYKYSYEVNYRGESRTFKAPEQETDEGIITVNVGDLGILTVDIQPGDIDFTKTRMVQVTVAYEDSAHHVDPIERIFTLDRTDSTHRFQEVIFEPQRNPYRWKARYFMTDGKEFEIDWRTGRSPQLVVNDPFMSIKTVGVRAVGNLETRIQTIFMDLKYEDKENAYIQTRSVALSKASPFFNWEFNVIDENRGEVTYSGMIAFADGTQETIPVTVAERDTIMVGETMADFLEVRVLGMLIPWSEVSLAIVNLSYEDVDNNVKETHQLIFNASSPQDQTWKIGIKDPMKKSFTWSAQFFMTDSSMRQTEATETEQAAFPLQLPQA